MKFSDLNPATAGAYHTSEVHFWLGTLESFDQFRPTRSFSRSDLDLSAAMTESLVAFARSGNPTTAQLKWPPFDESSELLLEFGQTVRTSNWPDQRKLDFFRSLSPSSPAVPPGTRN